MIELIIPGRPTLSLKNDRIKYKRTDGSEGNRPSNAVQKYMNIARNHIVQQLPSDFKIIEGSIGLIAVLYIKYGSDFPTADVSNSYETLQECLQNTVIHNDRQVEGFFPFRVRVASKEAEHAELYIFEVNNILDNMFSAVDYLKRKEGWWKNEYGNNEENGNDEFGDIDTDSGYEPGIDFDAPTIKAENPF